MDVACQVPLSIEFYRQEYWSGLLCPPTEDLPDPGMDPAFLSLLQWQMGSLPTTSTTWEALQGKRKCLYTCIFPWPFLGFPCGSAGKESVCNMGDLGSIPDWEDPLEEGIVAHSSILVWRIPWTEENGGLQSIGSQKLRHGWSNLAHTHVYLYIYHTYIYFFSLLWESK